MNIQGFNPSARSKSSWKLPRLNEELDFYKNQKFNVPFLALAETWLKKEITEAEISISGYNIFRSDRESTAHGGVILYVHEKIVVNDFSYFDNDICEGVICYSKLYKCIIGCIYRTPTCDLIYFSELLNFLNSFILKYNAQNDLHVYLFGDFNFPNIKWKDSTSFNFKSDSSCKYLINFMEDHFLFQYVEENTRKSNILDLFLTNNSNFVHLVKCEDLSISDHRLVKIFTNCFNFENTVSYETNSCNSVEFDFSTLNLNSANFECINNEFKNFNWENFIESSTVENFPERFKSKVFSVLERNVLTKNCNHKLYTSCEKRKRKITAKKIRVLKNKLGSFSSSPSSALARKLREKIDKLQKDRHHSYFRERRAQENAAINKIKRDKKYFFKYVNRYKTTTSSPSLLLDENENLITDPVKIADQLQDHFKSVFSTPNNNLDPFSNFSKPNISFPLEHFNVTTDDIIKAIDEMSISSSCPRNCIPAKVFKFCKSTLSKPLQLFCLKSFSTGIVPSSYKLQQIIPLFKKGLKTKASNHRPVALTSHVIKIMERVIRAKLVNYFESNNIFNANQHGFRKNRSCLSQLLCHLNNIQTLLISNNSVDTVYVDYAKAFDKVDHSFLIKKLEL